MKGDSIRDIQVVRVGICAICVSKYKNFERRASSFASVVLPERVPKPSRSEPEPLGEPELEEEAACHENKLETTKLGCRHLDKTKPEKLVNGKNTVHVRTGNGS